MEAKISKLDQEIQPILEQGIIYFDLMEESSTSVLHYFTLISGEEPTSPLLGLFFQAKTAYGALSKMLKYILEHQLIHPIFQNHLDRIVEFLERCKGLSHDEVMFQCEKFFQEHVSVVPKIEII